MDDFGRLLGSVKLGDTRFGKKPAAMDVYEKGLLLKFKKQETACHFAQIADVRAFNYFMPNPVYYNFDLIDTDGQTICALSVPYPDRANATMLLDAHSRFWLGPDFPANLNELNYRFDNNLSWQSGKLVETGRKGTKEYLPGQLECFEEKNGMFLFRVRDSKDFLTIFMYDSPNCLTSYRLACAIAPLKESI